jgi:flagellar motility protein MotE (MotC chaperone)
MRLPQPRVLPLAIGLTLVGIGIRTVDVISLAVSGAAFTTVTAAIADPAPDTKAAGETKPDAGVKVASAEAPSSTLMPSHAPVAEEGDAKSETDLLAQLTEKRKELDARSTELDQREALLKAAEDRINTKVEELTTMRSDLEKLLDLQKSKDDAQLNSLVKIYEDMKPKDAAAIFNSLDPNVLLEVTGRMKEAKMAPILAAMDPGRARMLTVKLSERRRSMDNAVADAKSALGDSGAPAPDGSSAPAAATPAGDAAAPPADKK